MAQSPSVSVGNLGQTHHFQAETIGVLLGLHMLQYERQVSDIRLMLDNQVVIAAMDACKSGPEQHIINKVL